MLKKLSPIGLELGRKLKEVYDDKSFVVSILSIADTENDRRKLIDFIDSNQNADIDSITILAMNLRRVREGHKPYAFRDD